MNPLQPIFWRQGLFLQPQHFQHNDRLSRYRYTRLASLTLPHVWGLASVEVDDSALINLSVTVNQLTVLTRDGVLIEYPGNAVLESRNFDLADLADGRTVYAGIRRMMPGQPNVQVFDHEEDAVKADTRFVASSSPADVQDVYTDGPQGHVELMSYVVRLFWEDEVEKITQYDLVPIIRLEQDGDQARLQREFIPPCLNVAASSSLSQLLRQIRDEVTGRARQLEVFKSTNAVKVQDADVSHVNLLMALTVLNRYGPMLHHLLENPTSHPWEIYGLLRQLVGELSSFSDRYNMLGETPDGRSHAPSYRHEDQGAGFHAMAMLIRGLLNEIAAAPEMLVRFVRSGPADGYFTADLPEGFFGQRHRYHLVATGEFDPDELQALITFSAKMAAPDQIESLVSHSLPGLELIHLPEAPRGVPRRSGALYFHIDTLSDVWATIEQTHELALFLPDSPPSLQLELIVTKW